MRYTFALVFAMLACGLSWWWIGAMLWAEEIPPAAVYAPPEEGTSPALVRTIQLPPLPGYESPKPVVAADVKGNVVVMAQGMTDSPLGCDLLVWRSTNRGRSWGMPENLTKVAKRSERSLEYRTYYDPWMETDGRGHYYAVYAHASDGRPHLLRSRDGGATWLRPLYIPWKGVDRPVLGISPNGKTLVVAGSMINGARRREEFAGRWRHRSDVFVSDDHGDSWEKCSEPFAEGEHAIPFSVVIDDSSRVASSWIVKDESVGSRSVVCTSHDHGRTWTTNTLVDSLQPDRPHPFNGARFPVVAADGKGNLHAAYVSSAGGTMMVCRSRDWKSWEPSITLSSTTAEEIRMAAIDAIGPMVHVTWVERTGETWQAYYRGSRDYAKTWSEPCCLSEEIELSDGTIQSGFELWASDDQTGVTDDGLGRIHAVWCVDGGSVIHATLQWGRPSSSAEQADATERRNRTFDVDGEPLPPADQ